MKRLISLVLFLSLSVSAKEPLPEVKEGDLIFQTSQSTQSVAIQRATRSPYSHTGIILMHKGKPHVFEAEATVRYTPLAQWIAHGSGGRYVVRRLKDADARMTPAAIQNLHAAAASFQGRPYDAAFAWSDERIYCSELVWKIYDKALHLRIGRLQRMKEFKLDDPLVRDALRERYGEHIPLEEIVVSPQAVFDSPLFATVAKR